MKGKVTLITGSSRGIGKAIAVEFARAGAHVVVHGRDERALRQTEAALRQGGGEVMVASADVTNFSALESMRHTIEDRFGPVDILVANAGGSFTPPAPLEEIPEEGWRATIDGNLLGTFLTLKSFLPGMKERRGGTIITISSTAGRRPDGRSPIPYAAAKAGIALVTQDLAAQVGPFGVRSNCIAPETILTERNLERIPEAQQHALADMHPLTRLGTPEDVAHAAVFLASEEASWITGVVFDVAGGAVMI